MEENTQVTQETQEVSETQETNDESTDNKELESKLAEAEARALKAEAEASRFKASIDKLTKEVAEKKREERAKLTEGERLVAEQAEELAKLKEKAESDLKELNHLKAVAAYKDITEESTIEKLIDAVSECDHAAIMRIITDECNKAVKAKEMEWKKNRPDGYVGSGSYPAKTKEEILAIKDDEERIREMAKHREYFR